MPESQGAGSGAVDPPSGGSDGVSGGGPVGLIRSRWEALSGAERRVARRLVADPTAGAFGSAASVAAAAGVSPQTVVRLARRLGFDGWPDLRDALRRELLVRPVPAVERLRTAPGAPLTAARRSEPVNVSVCLESLDERVLDEVAGLVADPRRRVLVAAAGLWRGVGQLWADWLAALRDGVGAVAGPPPLSVGAVAGAGRGDVLVVIDTRRYERWLADLVALGHRRGLEVLAVVDDPLAPPARGARSVLVVPTTAPGPFESASAVVALGGVLAAEVARRLRPESERRLAAAEEASAAAGLYLAAGEEDGS